ncbi:MAG: hypothetical protein EHM45_24885 [Desulfobacteraceae bacterium]|nr:MAG: hypothetical protein EHM45_24885 [Desulfobacteraceae bacterium]
MGLTVFWIAFLKEEKNPQGKILGRTPMGKGRFLLTNQDGTLMPVEEARKKVNTLEDFLPPGWSLEVKEEVVEPTAGTLHFAGNCPTHGLRTNEFFCGVCGTPLKPGLEP